MKETMATWRQMDFGVFKQLVTDKLPEMVSIIESINSATKSTPVEINLTLKNINIILNDENYFNVDIDNIKDEMTKNLKLAARKATLRILVHNLYEYVQTIDKNFVL